MFIAFSADRLSDGPKIGKVMIEMMMRGRLVLTLTVVILLSTVLWMMTHPILRIEYLSSVRVDTVEETFTMARTNIFFLKTHKCASSTVQNVLMRVAMKRNLDMALPGAANYLGHPQPFSKDMVGEKLRTPDDKYNMLAHHCRLSEAGVEEVMHPDAAWVTIVRNPSRLFESIFSYYHLDNVWKTTWEEFTLNRTQGTEQRLLGKIGLNQMAFDMGWEQGETAEAVIARVERAFDLVMVAEYMEASLVMLAELMGWPLEDVVFLSLNARPDERLRVMDPTTTQMLRYLNPIDSQIYDYFYDRFKKRAQEMGQKVLQERVNRLLNLNDRLFGRCIRNENLSGFALTVGYNISTSTEECRQVAMNELDFTDLVRDSQKRRIKVLKSLEAFF